MNEDFTLHICIIMIKIIVTSLSLSLILLIFIPISLQIANQMKYCVKYRHFSWTFISWHKNTSLNSIIDAKIFKGAKKKCFVSHFSLVNYLSKKCHTTCNECQRNDQFLMGWTHTNTKYNEKRCKCQFILEEFTITRK